jgi:Dolichyl-phosphate-mannose-protein mannosyltransferase
MVATDVDISGSVPQTRVQVREPRFTTTLRPAPAPSRVPLPRRRRPALPRPWVGLLLFGALAAGFLLPLWASVASGSIAIPHNDAWSYSRIAQEFGRTGHIKLLDWNRSSLIGQIVVLGPLARSIVAQQLFVAVLGLVCVGAVFDLALPLIGRERAALAAATMAIWPGFGLLSTSFMPDIPSLAACLCTLALGRRALDSGRGRRSWLLLSAAAAVGLWGVTVREQAIAAPAAVFVAALAARRYRSRVSKPLLFGVAVAFGAAVVVFELWRRGLPAGDPPIYDLTGGQLVLTGDAAIQGYFTVALALSPAVLFAARPWLWRRTAQLSALAVAGVGAWAVWQYTVSAFFPGNYLSRNGAYAVAEYDGPGRVVFSLGLWQVLVAVACVSGALLAGLLVEHVHAAEPLYMAFAVLTVAGTLVTCVSGQPVFDRYWIALPAVLLPVVLTRRSGPLLGRRRVDLVRIGCALGAGVLVAVVSLGVTFNGLVFDATRWRVAEGLTAFGVPVGEIDAGIEWVGYNSPDGVRVRMPSSFQVSQYDAMFPTTKACLVVGEVGGPQQSWVQPAWTLVGSEKYRMFGVTGRTADLFVYDTHLSGCPDFTW